MLVWARVGHAVRPAESREANARQFVVMYFGVLLGIRSFRPTYSVE